MNQSIIVGVWACLITLAGAYGGVYWRQHSSADAPAAAHEEKLEAHKVRPITVPIIADGALKGYVSAEFSLMTPKVEGHGHASALDPEGYVMDEAFRLIYAENRIDFADLRKSNLADLTSRITANVNKRLGKEAIREILVKNFAFIPREELPQ